eukprot:SAG22_NODE_15816_length_339_cov_1.291667_1_plen_74_part_01
MAWIALAEHMHYTARGVSARATAVPCDCPSRPGAGPGVTGHIIMIVAAAGKRAALGALLICAAAGGGSGGGGGD